MSTHTDTDKYAPNLKAYLTAFNSLWSLRGGQTKRQACLEGFYPIVIYEKTQPHHLDPSFTCAHGCFNSILLLCNPNPRGFIWHIGMENYDSLLCPYCLQFKVPGQRDSVQML